MNYLDVYFSRVNHFGETIAERINNSGIVAFEKWLAQSPFTVTDLSVERGYYFSGIIQTSKDKEEQKIMYLYVANDIPIVVGDIVTWRQDNGAIEKWLLLQKIHKVHEQYQTFQMVKCNYELKWIDTDGYLRKSWAYAVSSVDSKIKSNFRMWHSLISPQPNKFAEIIMPRPIFRKNSEDYNELMRGVTFIIENEGWIVIECDWTSVEGIIYISLTESKVNYQYDDRDIDVADTDRYKFPALPTLYKVGEQIVPKFEEDTLNQWEINLIKPDDCDFIDDNFNAIAPGQCIIKMQLKNRPAVEHEVEVTIYPKDEPSLIYIDGPDNIKLDRYGTYVLKADENIINAEISIQKNQKTYDYATIKEDVDSNNNKIYVLHANDKNKLGKVILIATYQGKEYTKTVEIIPLW